MNYLFRHLARVLFGVLVLLSPCTVFAQFPLGLYITCSSPLAPTVIYGSTVTFTLNGTLPGGAPVSTVQWSYMVQPPVPLLNGQWTTMGGGNNAMTVTTGFAWVCNFTIQAVATGMNGYQQATQTVQYTITVAPPDGITLPQGRDASFVATLGNGNVVNFPVTCLTLPVGGLQGQPLETLTQITSWGFRLPSWPPRPTDPPLPASGLAIAGLAIADLKVYTGPQNERELARWINAGPLATVASNRQQLFLSLPVGPGVNRTFPLLPTFSNTFQKNNDRTYVFTVGP